MSQRPPAPCIRRANGPLRNRPSRRALQVRQGGNRSRENRGLRIAQSAATLLPALQSIGLPDLMPSTLSASSNISCAAGTASASDLPIPTCCEPCPGNINAVFIIGGQSQSTRHTAIRAHRGWPSTAAPTDALYLAVDVSQCNNRGRRRSHCESL